MLALTDHLGQDLVDAAGRRIGRVCDLVVKLDEPFPPVVALMAKAGGGILRIPWDDVATFEGSQVSLRAGAGGPERLPRRVRESYVSRATWSITRWWTWTRSASPASARWS